jgi:hypothetical protein
MAMTTRTTTEAHLTLRPPPGTSRTGSLLVIDKLWWLLVKNDLLPEKSRPKHLLWTLYFLKVYPKQSPGCSVAGASSGAVDPKTFKKWVWMFIENIQELVDEVVSILFNLLVLSYRQ